MRKLLETAVELFEGEADRDGVGSDAWIWLQHARQALFEADLSDWYECLEQKEKNRISREILERVKRL